MNQSKLFPPKKARSEKRKDMLHEGGYQLNSKRTGFLRADPGLESDLLPRSTREHSPEPDSAL